MSGSATRAARGALIALEGIDGAGKSTLQAQLARRLRRAGFTVGLWREPTRPDLGRRAQRLASRDPMAGAIAFTVDRILGRRELERRLREHDLVLSDRSFYSTLAYQGSALPRARARELAQLQRAAAVRPDRVLLLDLPLRSALARVDRRRRERAPLEHRRTLERVAGRYREFARSPDWWTVRADRPEETVAEDALARVEPWLRRRTGRRRA